MFKAPIKLTEAPPKNGNKENEEILYLATYE